MPFNLSNLTPETIIFGGLTLVALALVGLIIVITRAYFKQSQNYYNHTNQVIDRNTDAWITNSAALQRLGDVIERFHER